MTHRLRRLLGPLAFAATLLGYFLWVTPPVEGQGTLIQLPSANEVVDTEIYLPVYITLPQEGLESNYVQIVLEYHSADLAYLGILLGSDVTPLVGSSVIDNGNPGFAPVCCSPGDKVVVGQWLSSQAMRQGPHEWVPMVFRFYTLRAVRTEVRVYCSCHAPNGQVATEVVYQPPPHSICWGEPGFSATSACIRISLGAGTCGCAGPVAGNCKPPCLSPGKPEPVRPDSWSSIKALYREP